MAIFTRSIILSCGLLGLGTSLAQAQSIPFTKEQFTIDKDGLKLAQRELELGDHEMGADPARFGAALPHYLRAQKFNPKNALLNAKIGECYLHSATKQEALPYLQRAQQLDAKAEPRLHYLLARALHLGGQWEAAIKEYEQARPVAAEATSDDVAVTTDDLARCVRECHRGQQMQAHPVRVKLENVGPNINSAMSDYAPLISADESVLLLTSRRAGSTGGQLDAEGDGMLEDIYQSDWTGSGWSPARNLGAPVNTAHHDATVGLSADGQHLLVYMEDNEGDIYESDLIGNAWSKPKNLGARLNTKYHESAACYSPDGKYLYFVSDRPEGNRGGRDIYRLELDARTPAENLGPVINSPYDEEGVFMHPDGKTLYFSSKGHDSMGGYDIFKSTLNAKGQWSEPENLGWPINTPDDDVYFVMSASGQHGYYSSDQPGGLGGKDIYRVTFLGPEPAPAAIAAKTPTKPKPGAPAALGAKAPTAPAKPAAVPALTAATLAHVTVLKGMVTDAVSKKPLAATIEVIDNSKGEVIATYQSNAATGRYLISLPSGLNYGVAVRQPGYLLYSENVNLAANAPYAERQQDVALNRPTLGSIVELRNIFFAPAQADLRPESAAELIRLQQLLTEQPTLRLELSGQGDADASADLRQQRAEAILAYLTSHGIARARLSTAALGQPVASVASTPQPTSGPTAFRVVATAAN
ncbi:OmpA family protein [Hymenobacter setariae]|uniref:OmpA family protein n=1 Tax=Hymenobacter setariae TaxID=2594794 RepID=A0A558BVG4_9BACT|nr:OmpA family protein [Hymenobacter setariae]TVT40517.1 OmpA family protein [Hymenobacter setariae]